MAENLFSSKQPEYPWQLELPEWAPHAKLTEAERRAEDARRMFDWELEDRRENGWGADPLLFYDALKALFRFSDGTFALSRKRGNWPALKEGGFFFEWGM